MAGAGPVTVGVGLQTSPAGGSTEVTHGSGCTRGPAETQTDGYTCVCDYRYARSLVPPSSVC